MITTQQSRELMRSLKDREDAEIAAAYARILSVADSRVEGKEFAPRRPACGIKLTLGNGLIAAEFKPELVNSPEGWKVGRVFMTMKTVRPEGGRPATLKLQIFPDGRMRGCRWTVATVESLLSIAQDLLRLLARDEAYLLAAADADHCACCGRALTDPDSRAAGIGPECIEHFYVKHAAPDLFNPAPQPQTSPEHLAARIKEIRFQIMQAHPDRGGDGDGALFARLTAELDSLRQRQRKAA